jgi:predicted permease
MKSFLRKLGWLTRRRSKEADLQEELRFHLQEEAELRQAEGLPDEDARWAARRELGSVTLISENTRAAWGWTLLEQLAQDLRYAFRTMAANRLFTALAILSLALGIGANTAIYSFMDSILLRSLPVPDPESLVVFNWHAMAGRRTVMHSMSGSTWGDAKTGVDSGMFPFPAFELFRKSEVFSSVFGYFRSWRLKDLNVTVGGQAELASGQTVSGDFFRGLAIPPAAGRLIMADDDRPEAAAVAVISHAFSQKRFGSDANAAGQPVLINNLPFTVVGVAPPGFFGIDPAAPADVYIPIHANEFLGAIDPFGFGADSYIDPNYYWIQVLGRLRPGITLAQAQAALAPQFQQWVAATAANDSERANLPALVIRPAAGGLDTLRRRYSQPLYVLLTLVGLILAIACANVANLLLARAAARRREIALRLSVGAGRFRVVRQLLTESVLLASLGGVLGIVLAIWGIRFLTLLLASGQRNFTLHAELNWHVLGAAAGLSLLTGILFGLAPALQATRIDVIPALKESRTGGTGPRHSFRRPTLSHVLVVGQIALSLLMLVAAGLFVRTLSNLQSVELGFNRENVLLFQVDARKAGHRDPEISTFYGDLRARLAAIPGVRHASLGESSLITAGTGLPISFQGKPVRDDTSILSIGPTLLSTMQIPILAGREITERDRPGSPAVAVINECFAKATFGDRNPLGQHLVLSKGNSPARDMEIVGVSRDAIYGGLKRQIPPLVYIPFDQGYPEPNEMVYALRTAGDPLVYVNAVRGVIRQADARVPVSDIKTQVAEIDETISQEITLAKLCTAFAILALIIASVGLYGTMSYNVARRTGEIGIRMALGAPRGTVVWMVLREVLVVAAVGLAIAAPVVYTASKLVESFLFGMKPNDPLALAAAVVTLAGAAMLAGYVPARKASRIDPMVALRHE